MQGFCRPYRACWWWGLIPGRRHAFSVPCPGLFPFAPDGAPATEDGFSYPSLRSQRTDTSALLVKMTGEGVGSTPEIPNILDPHLRFLLNMRLRRFGT